jgi:hypothetical protein
MESKAKPPINSSTHPVDVTILKDRFGETSLRYAQHGATYVLSRCHVVREKHLPQRIEGSHQSVSRPIPCRLRANALKELNVAGAKQEHSFKSHLQECIFCSAFYPRHINLPRSVLSVPAPET